MIANAYCYTHPFIKKKIEIEKNKYTKNKKIQHHPTIQINVREDRKNNQQWTIQRNWQHRVHKTKTNKTKTQHNMHWAQLYTQINTNNLNKT